MGSLPLRERGLKSLLPVCFFAPAIVAPLAGAWVEISLCTRPWRGPVPSLPLRERGLKYYDAKTYATAEMVAPLAGAWVEITTSISNFLDHPVAPLAGAWVEMSRYTSVGYVVLSRSPCGSVG